MDGQTTTCFSEAAAVRRQKQIQQLPELVESLTQMVTNQNKIIAELTERVKALEENNTSKPRFQFQAQLSCLDKV